MNPNVLADSKHRQARQYAAVPEPVTAMGALDDLVQSISTSATTMRRISEAVYIELLQLHDWHFERSDDGRAYRAGQKQLADLMLLQREVDPDGAIWNAHCDDGCQLRVTR